jgi:hypothetical protein
MIKWERRFSTGTSSFRRRWRQFFVACTCERFAGDNLCITAITLADLMLTFSRLPRPFTARRIASASITKSKGRALVLLAGCSLK